jgi:putative aldouronate transport system permease protein
MQKAESLIKFETTYFKRSRTLKNIFKYRYIYILMIPGILYFIIFRYLPMFGVLIAFNDYNPTMGIIGFFTAKFVGFNNFEILFKSIYFKEIIFNTVILSIYKLLFGFPAPIILALMLNEIRSRWYKRTLQTVTYLPHFISWVVLAGMLFEFLSVTSGSFTNIIYNLTGSKPNFLSDPKLFRGLLVVTDIWKEMGWGSIIYLAAIAGVDAQQYEASIIDGASRFKQLVHITIPGIMPTIIIMLILRLGYILDAGFEQIFMLYSPMVYNVADIIDTFVYREGLLNSRYGFATAMGLFKSVIGLVLILSTNKLVKKFGHNGLI